MSDQKLARIRLATLLLVLSTFTCHFVVKSAGDSNADILNTFRKSLANDSALYNWNQSDIPCSGSTNNWVGLRCNDDGSIDKLILENMGLVGIINLDALARLPKLRTLSLMQNSFDGPMPDVKKLTSLRNLYLSDNRFSGEIPDEAFIGMNSLRLLYLERNQFNGEIPRSLVGLTKLTNLSLEGNQFEGNIPDFQQKFLEFNLANNHLNGTIPPALSYLDPSSFAGNNGLCGKPLPPCAVIYGEGNNGQCGNPLPSCTSKSSKKKTVIIITAVAASVVALAAILAITFIRGRRAKTTHIATTKFKEARLETTKPEAATKFTVQAIGKNEVSSPDRYQQGGNIDRKGSENGNLHFVRNDRDRFELQDLLRASAEVLGSGNFGSSYKAVLLDGPAMVVKRFKEMNNVGKEEFYEHMRRLGRLSHPNLLPLVAFYYRKEEKLLISDYVENGSLASHLHAKRAPGQPGLDWPTRLKIIRGVARGLAYLYKEFPSLSLPHGHLKSSHVLLDHTYEPLLTDYALVPVVTKDHAQEVMVAYKSPEFTKADRTTRKTDVWSLGILILEMITGKFPANYLRQGRGANADLATWVNSVVREEWTGEVFDTDMKGTKNGEGEMLKLLKIGLCCCEWNVERRWDLMEAVRKIEELKERDSDTEEFSSYASEGEIYSSRAMTDDDFSFSVTK